MTAASKAAKTTLTKQPIWNIVRKRPPRRCATGVLFIAQNIPEKRIELTHDLLSSIAGLRVRLRDTQAPGIQGGNDLGMIAQIQCAGPVIDHLSHAPGGEMDVVH